MTDTGVQLDTTVTIGASGFEQQIGKPRVFFLRVLPTTGPVTLDLWDPGHRGPITVNQNQPFYARVFCGRFTVSGSGQSVQIKAASEGFATGEQQQVGSSGGTKRANGVAFVANLETTIYTCPPAKRAQVLCLDVATTSTDYAIYASRGLLSVTTDYIGRSLNTSATGSLNVGAGPGNDIVLVAPFELLAGDQLNIREYAGIAGFVNYEILEEPL